MTEFQLEPMKILAMSDYRSEVNLKVERLRQKLRHLQLPSASCHISTSVGNDKSAVDNTVEWSDSVSLSKLHDPLSTLQPVPLAEDLCNSDETNGCDVLDSQSVVSANISRSRSCASSSYARPEPINCLSTCCDPVSRSSRCENNPKISLCCDHLNSLVSDDDIYWIGKRTLPSCLSYCSLNRNISTRSSNHQSSLISSRSSFVSKSKSLVRVRTQCTADEHSFNHHRQNLDSVGNISSSESSSSSSQFSDKLHFNSMSRNTYRRCNTVVSSSVALAQNKTTSTNSNTIYDHMSSAESGCKLNSRSKSLGDIMFASIRGSLGNSTGRLSREKSTTNTAAATRRSRACLSAQTCSNNSQEDVPSTRVSAANKWKMLLKRISLPRPMSRSNRQSTRKSFSSNNLSQRRSNDTASHWNITDTTNYRHSCASFGSSGYSSSTPEYSCFLPECVECVSPDLSISCQTGYSRSQHRLSSLDETVKYSSSDASYSSYSEQPQHSHHSMASFQSSNCSCSQPLKTEDICLDAWLKGVGLGQYYSNLCAAGYDLPTLTRCTPEDLLAVGVTNPLHRQLLTSAIAAINMTDAVPRHVPESLSAWLRLMRLEQYTESLRTHGVCTVQHLVQVDVEDLEQLGIERLGHQKRFLLGIKRLKTLLKPISSLTLQAQIHS